MSAYPKGQRVGRDGRLNPWDPRGPNRSGRVSGRALWKHQMGVLAMAHLGVRINGSRPLTKAVSHFETDPCAEPEQ